MSEPISRRDFLRNAAIAGAGLAVSSLPGSNKQKESPGKSPKKESKQTSETKEAYYREITADYEQLIADDPGFSEVVRVMEEEPQRVADHEFELSSNPETIERTQGVLQRLQDTQGRDYPVQGVEVNCEVYSHLEARKAIRALRASKCE